MTKFVNNGPTVDHYFPGGHPESLHVENGQIVDVGDAKVEDGGDCWLVGEGDDVRAWPKSRWQKHGGTQKSSKESTKASAKSDDDKTPEKSE